MCCIPHWLHCDSTPGVTLVTLPASAHAVVVITALLGAAATEPGRRAVVAALLAAPPALQRLLQLVEVIPRRAVLRSPFCVLLV